MGKLSILSELWDFLKVRKKWWLAPILILLLLLGGLIILTQGSALAPFIYAIFQMGSKSKIKVEKKKKRIPVPKKPPKVEKNPKAYDRKKSKKNLRKKLKEDLPTND